MFRAGGGKHAWNEFDSSIVASSSHSTAQQRLSVILRITSLASWTKAALLGNRGAQRKLGVVRRQAWRAREAQRRFACRLLGPLGGLAKTVACLHAGYIPPAAAFQRAIAALLHAAALGLPTATPAATGSRGPTGPLPGQGKLKRKVKSQLPRRGSIPARGTPLPPVS